MPRRVFIGPREIAGYFAGLKRGFDALGVPCELASVSAHRFAYADASLSSGFARAAVALARRFDITSIGRALRTASWIPLHVLARAALLIWAIGRCDVFVFACGSSLLYLAELPLLRALGKTIVFVFTGSDSRPPYLNAKFVKGPLLRRLPLALPTKALRWRVRWIESFAHVTVDNPLSAHLHTRPFVSWFRIGFPMRPFSRTEGGDGAGEALGRPPATPEEPPGAPARVRVLHAPSTQIGKGTERIVETVDALNREGAAIDLVLLRGLQHADVLAELGRCDFVIDELYSDAPGGAFALEAACFGKPAIVAGYGEDEFRRWIPDGLMPAVHYCRPERLAEAIDRLARDRFYRSDLGSRARAFVRGVYAPEAVASRLLRAVGGAPRDWWVDPGSIRHVHGWGLHEEDAREAVRRLLAGRGRAALGLSGKRGLERALVRFARGGSTSP